MIVSAGPPGNPCKRDPHRQSPVGAVAPFAKGERSGLADALAMEVGRP